MRRTLALAGAVALTVGLGGLTGPAVADTGSDVALVEPSVVISEIGVGLDSTAHGFKGIFVELVNNSGSEVNLGLDGFELSACSATGSLTPLTTFTSSHTVPAGGHFLIADPAFASGDGPDADIPVSSLNLDQSDGGMLVEDTINSLEDTIRWETPADLVCSGFLDAENAPTNDESIRRAGPPWLLTNPPTPTNSAGETS